MNGCMVCRHNLKYLILDVFPADSVSTVGTVGLSSHMRRSCESYGVESISIGELLEYAHTQFTALLSLLSVLLVLLD